MRPTLPAASTGSPSAERKAEQLRPLETARSGFGLVGLVLCLAAASCSGSTTAAPDGAADAEVAILALGDSIFEWNVWTDESIPDVISEVLGRPVLNAAVGGAWFANPDPGAATEGLDIRQQYVEDDWGWVVIGGGGNDLNGGCGCGACESVLDDLVSADGRSGKIPDFSRSLLEDGTQVMFVGYYEVPSDAQFGFDRCGHELTEHGRRLQAMAAEIDGIWFVSAEDVVSADNRTAYAEDRVHPSPAGSRLVGEHVAAAIERAEANEEGK
jgi:acyl-CoA thioesterase-1